jgi:hypothetical protein
LSLRSEDNYEKNKDDIWLIMAVNQSTKTDNTLLSPNDYPFILKIKSEVEACFAEEFIPQVQSHLKQELELIEALRAEVKSRYSGGKGRSKKDLTEEIDSRKRLHEIIAKTWLAPQNAEFETLFPSYYTRLDAIIEDVAPISKKQQLKARFIAQPGDNVILRFRKSFKRFFHWVTSLPRRTKNLFIKKKQPIPYWRHTIPFRNLIDAHYRNQVNRALISFSEIFYKKLAQVYLELKQNEEALFTNASNSSPDLAFLDSPTINEIEEDILNDINLVVSEAIEGITVNAIDAFEKVGTIELRPKRYSAARVAKVASAIYKEWYKNNVSWENTLYALFEEWRSDLEIHQLKYQTQLTFETLKKEQNERLEDQVVTKVGLIRDFIKEAKTTLTTGTETNSLRLKKVLIQAKKQLDKKLVPSLTEAVSSRNFLNQLNILEHETTRNIEAIADDHIISKTNTYDAPIPSSDLSTTSPYELIAFELLAKFEDAVEEIKSKLFLEIEKVNAVFRDIDHVIIFSVSSGISLLEDKETEEDEAIALAIEGIDRADNRLNDGMELLTTALKESTTALQEKIDDFGDNLIRLTDNDNVFELKVRITKAKTLQQAEDVREKLKEQFLSGKDRVVRHVKQLSSSLNTAFQQARARFILTAKTQEISREISDFLLESSSAMDKLPTIYRQLYKIEPLTDLELFEGRDEELDKFKNAYSNWEKGRFASTIVIGEKWGGQTSFINYVTRSKIISYPILRQSLPKTIRSEEDFFAFLKDLIKTPELDSIAALIDELNEGRKRVIIIEDLQNVFIRKVGGFEALNFLFDLIAQTNTNVFWVSSSNSYTWSYLEKTVRANEHFSYPIKMGIFSNQQIKDIIWKRNSISGFQIKFEPEPSHLSNKKFKKLTFEAQQKQLEDEFFKSLCDFASSNVSMALIFWLLSTNSVDARQITIGAFKRPNLNFLGALSSEKILVLYALILHDGLTEAEIGEVQNISPNITKMLVLSLMEDSIITLKGERYTLNPLIYRDAISILKTKNLIQ